MITQVAIYIYRVLNIIAIEGDGILSDRTHKRILQQSHIVVVDIYISKHILECNVKDVARLDELVNTRRTLSFDDALFRLWVFAIYLLRHGLVDRNGQDELMIKWACLYLIDEPLLLSKEATIKVRRLDVVESKRNLLIFIILQIVVVLQVGLLLCSYHPTHQFYRRVILTAILTALRFHHNFFKLLSIRFQLHVELYRSSRGNVNSLRLISNGTKRELPTIMSFDGILSHSITAHSHMVTFIRSTRIKQRVAILGIYDNAMYLLRIGVESHHKE